jgi:acetylornithine aminotransferase
MIGIELDHACSELVQQALERGLLINVTVDNVIRLLPPLNFRREEAELLLATLVPLVTEFLDRQSASQPAAQPA